MIGDAKRKEIEAMTVDQMDRFAESASARAVSFQAKADRLRKEADEAIRESDELRDEAAYARRFARFKRISQGI